QTSQWFHRIEKANDYVLYLADPQPSNWSKLCLRQADALVLLARYETEPQAWRALQAIEDEPTTTPRAEIVLVREGSKAKPASRRWLDVYPAKRHHHVQTPADIARLARFLTGRALGVVLSGGGARGFAQIGAMRALQKSGLPIDAIGATSI